MEDVIKFIGDNQEMIYIIVLAIFVGFVLIANVPSVLHTPLMSGANAMSGVVIIGAIILMGKTDPDNTLALLLGSIAVVLGSFNVVGGFVVTDRMLQMFKKKPKKD
jgi:NAD(P) transhydrogenase subunit alpha